ncbi:hypothetical protein [Nonomuraea sp. NPDC049129]|uniref:hypothetical protein n=1 Tax=Nonomuraea sp. NPDC049129 TaxID=3155272 RepID=UPI0033F9C958
MFITIRLHRLTFGQLYWFVDAARASNMNPSSLVSYEWDDLDDYDPHITGLIAHIIPSIYAQPIEPLAPGQKRDLARTLDAVIHAGGDARALLPTLQQWRDLLLRLPSPPFTEGTSLAKAENHVRRPSPPCESMLRTASSLPLFQGS